MQKVVVRLMALLIALPLYSATVVAEEGVIEEIIVTGSYIRKTAQADSFSPITNIDRAAIDDTGILTSQELFRWLPSNTGSENQADSLTQGGTTGTANVNLRGLGLGSTLVLVNGRRQTVAAQTANGGDTFVDLNSLMPFIMVENIEVLKDGAAAIYGSDAVAGVVNYKTRSDFEGFELRGNFQSTSRGDDHQDTDISAMFGGGNDRTHLVAAVKYFERDELRITERRNLPRRTVSGLGNPGTYVLTGPSPAFPGLAPGTPVADPNCTDGTGSILIPAGGGGSRCLFDFGPSFTLAPEEKRMGGYVVANHDFNENLTLFAEFGYARNETSAGFSPSFPALNFPFIADTHPDNPYGVGVVALYRPIGDGSGEPGGQRVVNSSDATTTRFVVGADGAFGGDNDWGYNLAYTFSDNNVTATGNDQVGSRLGQALSGFGGVGCNAAAGVAGANGCEYFNPFGTSINAGPGDPGYNSPEILAFINSTNPTKTDVDLVTWDAVVSGSLFETKAGTVGLAVGYQRREESRKTDRSEDAEREDLAFLFGGPDVDAEQEIDAFFAEMYIPIMQTDTGHALEAQLAVRYEDYDVGFDSTDPKIGLLYRYNDRFSARFTYGTAFRAPTLFQTNNEVTSLNQAQDAFLGTPAVFIGNTAQPNADLVPEEATTYNIGFTYAPIDNLEFSLDYYNVEYEDRLVQEAGQQVLNEEGDALTAAGCTPATLNTPACLAVRNPNIIRDPTTGSVSRIFVNRFNAASAETDGVDFTANWTIPTDFGTFNISNNTTYIASFDLQAVAGGSTIDGAGRRNESSPLANSIPELRSNTNFSWSLNNHFANIIVRYIDSYDEDDRGAPGSPNFVAGGSVDSWTVLDLQYSYRFDIFDDNEASVTFGVLNATDEDPPEVAGNNNEFGYDTKVHDARGSVWYARFVYNIP